MLRRHFFANLAKVSPDKLEEDRCSSTGDFAIFSYFSEEEKKEYQVISNSTFSWTFADSKTEVENNKYMYIVDPNGDPFVFNATVHSQANAGQPVRCAGWVEYDKENPSMRVIDNCSGHYTPTLSQFITTLNQLHEGSFLSNEFRIKFSKFTKIDVALDQCLIIKYFTEMLSRGDDEIQFTVLYRNDEICFVVDDTIFIAKKTAFLPETGLDPANLTVLMPDIDDEDTPGFSDMVQTSFNHSMHQLLGRSIFTPGAASSSRHSFFSPDQARCHNSYNNSSVELISFEDVPLEARSRELFNPSLTPSLTPMGNGRVR